MTAKIIRKLLFLWSLFIFTNGTLHAQTVTGIVQDTLHNNLQNANVQILDNANATIAYTRSDADGRYKLQVKQTGNYSVKVSYLGYETKIIATTITNDITLDFILYQNTAQLEEVVINAEKSEMLIKGDTLQYVIDNFMNGTESTLKDVIKKLPGLGIDENGKITYRGKIIDKLLVEGDEFFKNQHSTTTENIAAEIIKNVQIINNYKDFGTIKDSTKNDRVALNVNIKDQYKNKLTGNVRAGSGYENKFTISEALMSFSKKIKFGVVGNTNNTGVQGITLNDYFEMTNRYDPLETREAVTFTTADDVPVFLSAGNNAEKRKTDFAAVTFTANPNKKLKVNLYSVFNKSVQTQRQFVRQDFYNYEPQFFNVEDNIRNDRTLFNKTALNGTYVYSDRTTYKFNSDFNYFNLKDNSRIENLSGSVPSIYFNNGRNNKINLAAQLAVNTLVRNKNLLNASLYYNHEKKDNNISIIGLQPFLNELFFNNNYVAKQEESISKDNVGYAVNYTVKFKRNAVKFENALSLQKSALYSIADISANYTNDLSTQNLNTNAGLSYIYTGKVMTYGAGIKYVNLNRRYLSETANLSFASSSLSLKAFLNKYGSISLTYAYTNKTPEIEYLLTNKLIVDYRNIIGNENISFNSLFPENQFFFNYNLFTPKNTFTLIAAVNYNVKNNNITTNTFITPQLTATNYKVGPSLNSLTSMLFLEFPLNKKIKFNSGLNYFNSENIIYTENLENKITSNSFSGQARAVTTLQDFPVNFEAGISVANDVFTSGSTTNTSLSYRPLLNITGKTMSYLVWSLNLSNDTYKTDIFRRNIFLVSPELKYVNPKIKWEFSLTGFNVLNINTGERIESLSTTNFFQQKIYSTLRGYVMLNLKYKL